jgi:hypothetical protein
MQIDPTPIIVSDQKLISIHILELLSCLLFLRLLLLFLFLLLLCVSNTA